MNARPRFDTKFALLFLMAVAGLSIPPASAAAPERFTSDFRLAQCEGFSTAGQNPYFVLEPGFETVLEGRESKADVSVTALVTEETFLVDGVLTRVLVETETADGELVEISRNYFAICNRDNSVVYYGEDVDIYEQGVITSHEGSWRAGADGAKPGILMPGTLLVGSRYFQEIAETNKALDRAEVVSLTAVVETPAGTFDNCLKSRETTPLKKGKSEIKHYAPGIGLIQDGPLKLVSFSRR